MLQDAREEECDLITPEDVRPEIGEIPIEDGPSVDGDGFPSSLMPTGPTRGSVYDSMDQIY